MNNKLGTASLVAILGFLTVCITSLTVLILAGKDPSTVLALMGTAIVPLVGQIALGRRIDNVGEQVAQTKTIGQTNKAALGEVTRAVNGNLDRKIAGLVDELETRLKQ